MQSQEHLPTCVQEQHLLLLLLLLLLALLLLLLLLFLRLGLLLGLQLLLELVWALLMLTLITWQELLVSQGWHLALTEELRRFYKRCMLNPGHDCSSGIWLSRWAAQHVLACPLSAVR
jgi:hypothetical protein